MKSSWTGVAKPCTKNADGTWSVEQLHLANLDEIAEFNVRVVKDEDSALAKEVRYDPFDCQIVPTGTSSAVNLSVEWLQVQLTLAYALTAHKAQGLTMNVTYIALNMVFGFGLPYTLITRTPYEENMLFIGVVLCRVP